MDEINYAIFEPSGDFSVLLKGENLNVENKDLKIEKENQLLNTSLVIDGKIIEEELIKYDKDINWLLNKTKLKSEKEIKKKILLFSYCPSDDSFYIFEK